MASKKIWLGLVVTALAFGMTVIGCDNGSTSSKGDYHLKWGATYTSLSEVRSNIESHGWAVAETDNYSWTLGTGSDAKNVYDWCMDNVDWIEAGDFDGSLEECLNYTKEGVGAPEPLKAAIREHSEEAPFAGIYDAGSFATLFYITKN